MIIQTASFKLNNSKMKLSYLIFLFLIIFSCSSPEGNLFEINPQTFTDNKITLAEIADDIKYIPLDNSFPIEITYSMRITNNNIYISIKDVGIVQFDLNGKFVRNIGHKGRGPGEYRYGMEFAVDEKNGRTYVADNDKIKIYNQGGVFLRDISHKEYIGSGAEGVEMFESLLFIPDYNTFGNSKFNWIILDTLGNLVSKKVNSVPPVNGSEVQNGCIYKFENKLFYFNLLNDTIFSISTDLKAKGAYLFSKGDYRWPEGLVFNSFYQLYKLFIPHRMFETKHFIFLTYNYLDRSALALIDKTTKKTFLAYKYDEKSRGIVKTRVYIINDLDGGMPWSTRYITYYYVGNDSEYITTLINPFDFKAYISSTEFKNAIPKYPEKKKALEKLAKSLKETDNPVLMMVRLKK
jgi:hypothetical protein